MEGISVMCPSNSVKMFDALRYGEPWTVIKDIAEKLHLYSFSVYDYYDKISLTTNEGLYLAWKFALFTETSRITIKWYVVTKKEGKLYRNEVSRYDVLDWLFNNLNNQDFFNSENYIQRFNKTVPDSSDFSPVEIVLTENDYTMFELMRVIN